MLVYKWNISVVEKEVMDVEFMPLIQYKQTFQHERISNKLNQYLPSLEGKLDFIYG